MEAHVLPQISRRVKTIRKAHKMTQAEFAAALGYDRSRTISEIERGQSTANGTLARLLDYVERFGPLPSDPEHA